MKGMLLFSIILTMMLVMQPSLGAPGDRGGRANGSVETKKTGESRDSSKPLSEVRFQVTETSFGRARLIPVEVQETLIPPPGYCGAVGGGKEIQGKFRLEFEIEGKPVGAYILELAFVEGHDWDPSLKKSSLPLRGQGKEQIVIIQYESCNSVSAMIFGYDLRDKKLLRGRNVVRYSFINHFGETSGTVSLSSGTSVAPDGRVQILELGKPEGIFQEQVYSQAWGTILVRYRFDPVTHRFLEIPMVVALKTHPNPGEHIPPELALYEDGYLTDMHGEEKFMPKIEVFKLLELEAAKGVRKLREKFGAWPGAEFGGGRPFYDFFFGMDQGTFLASCGHVNCPKELLFMKDKLLDFWKKHAQK